MTQLSDLNNDIFEVLRGDFDIDLRILRMVAKGFGALIGDCRNGYVADRIISAIKVREFGLVEWYHVSSARITSLSTLERHDYKFVEMYYNHIPMYILTDHPSEGVQPAFMRRYMRILGIERYYKLAVMQPPTNLNIGGRGQDALACEIVHDCRSAEDTYRACLLLLGHWNAPHNLADQVVVNASYRNMTQLQVHSLHFLVLCNGNASNIDSILRLYKYNDMVPSVELNVANMYIRGVFISEQQYLQKMITARNELVAAGADPLIDEIFKRTLMPRIRAIDSTSIALNST